MKKYILMFVQSQWHLLNIDDFNDYKFGEFFVYSRNDVLITFQTSDLIRHLSKDNTHGLLPAIVDLESFDKQMSQEGKEFREYNNWKAIHFLRHHKVIDSEFNLKPDGFKFFLEHLANLYTSLINKDNGEKDRFETLEAKVNKLIYERQLKGVKIDLNIAKQKCEELEKEIYKVKNILQLEYHIFVPENEAQQLSYLESKNYNVLFSQPLLYTFKAWRNKDVVCNLFYELIRNMQDLDSMLYVLSHWGGDQKTYPTYLGFGTITSRIILRQPSLQNLRKSNRIVLIPDIGMKFLYIDYSQFEAGLLACLSKDELLIKLYNEDIYSDLAEQVLGDKKMRKEAKIIFYRYMYGDMSLDKVSQKYFQKFKSLEEYRKNIETEISSKRKVGTANANYRYSNGEEHSWALSHVIQGTASLIYKNALVRVRSEVPEAEFLIPMHDATLYQISKLLYEDCKEKIERIYMEEFKKVCPQINPSVTCSELF